MKKIILTTVISAVLSANVFAADGVKKTNNEGKATVSNVAETKFRNDFIRAQHITWEVNANVQKANFELDGVKMTAFYNLRSEYMGVTQSVQFKVLPESAKVQIAKNYEGYFANDVIKLDTGEDGPDSIVYFVDLQKNDAEFLVKVTPTAVVTFFKTIK